MLIEANKSKCFRSSVWNPALPTQIGIKNFMAGVS